MHEKSLCMPINTDTGGRF